MSLDEQLSELLRGLGVSLEGASDAGEGPAGREGRSARRGPREMAQRRERTGMTGQTEQGEQPAESLEETVSAYQHPGDWEEDDDMMAQAELSLFQTSREHYGVFYRLDLVDGAPHLRIFAPDEEGALKMRCYLVRPALGAPVRDWFLTTRSHRGSEAFGESRETIEQHLLFAAGETLKRLFWSGEPERMRFPWEIEVDRVA
ncbi:MAG TPA: hypothetical protein VF812_07275 [Ktedonobacterales bacterium]